MGAVGSCCSSIFCEIYFRSGRGGGEGPMLLLKLSSLGYGCMLQHWPPPVLSSLLLPPPHLVLLPVLPPVHCRTMALSPRSLQQQPSSIDVTVATRYHQETKHSLGNYARGPHGLDWANQPTPFRRYLGAPVVPLHHFPDSSSHDPLYSQVFSDLCDPKPLSQATLSQLLYDSLALSAWKTSGYSTWSLRVNPSSGNLHPTEGYVISGPLGGVSDSAFVAHYSPKEHALEIRAEIPGDLWKDLAEGFPAGTFFVGFTSIFWREAWKYGERAFRYCNHDVGHAIGAISIAGATLGWDSVLLDGWGACELESLFGLTRQNELSSACSYGKGYFPELEQEHADCLMAIFPRRATTVNLLFPSDTLVYTVPSRISGVPWNGQPNALSRQHLRWDIIYKTSAACRKPAMTTPVNLCSESLPEAVGLPQLYKSFTIRQVVRKRRSAVDMDSGFSMQRDAFYQILQKATPSGLASDRQGVQIQVPFRALPWKAELHMALFVHRVVGMMQGLYFLVRNSDHEKDLRLAMRPDFEWAKPEGCPEGLSLYRLAAGDCRTLAKRVSCHQEIAGDSFFSLGMIAHFERPIEDMGSWMYPRLFWESGVLGQLLYLEAHAVGVSATGIGCYFDDAVHEILGFSGKKFQSLYHFTIGVPVLDKRIMSLPAYPGPTVDA